MCTCTGARMCPRGAFLARSSIAAAAPTSGHPASSNLFRVCQAWPGRLFVGGMRWSLRGSHHPRQKQNTPSTVTEEGLLLQPAPHGAPGPCWGKTELHRHRGNVTHGCEYSGELLYPQLNTQTQTDAYADGDNPTFALHLEMPRTESNTHAHFYHRGKRFCVQRFTRSVVICHREAWEWMILKGK